MSDVNKDYSICASYPRFIVLPAAYTAETMRYRILDTIFMHTHKTDHIPKTKQLTILMELV